MEKSEFILKFFNKSLVVLILDDNKALAVEKDATWSIPIQWYKEAIETFKNRILN